MIKFAKLRPEAKIPTKEVEDAGYDIYACFDKDYMLLYPGEIIMVPTGIASACDHLHYFRIAERGSSGTKGMAVRCAVMDSGFRNEWKIVLNNTSNKPIAICKKEEIETLKEFYPEFAYSEDVVIYPYEKAIAQAIYERVDESEVEEISYEELENIPSKRGMGMLGSSGK